MPPCDRCGAIVDLPYQCAYCGGTHCGEHRLPENHACPGLEEWGDPSGVFDSGFDAGLRDETRPGEGSILGRLGIDTGPGGPLAYLRGNMTYVFLTAMWIVFFVQQIVLATVGLDIHNALFVLEPTALWAAWTWVTSIFAHGSLMHILFNSIVLYFFGPIVERKVGPRMFTLLFFGAGILAGLSQVVMDVVLFELAIAPTLSPGVVGASGAILAIMGVLTVLNPNLRVLLFFIVPMPLWALTLGFAAFSVFVMVGAGIGAGNIAHLAHLIGLVIGLAYGEHLRRAGETAPDQLQLGGGGGGRPPRGRF